MEQINSYQVNQDTNTLIDEKLYYMIKARDSLDKIPKDERNIEYQQIYLLIKEYISKNCDHVFINDTIDIHPDKSDCITYCCKCFTHENFYTEPI